MPRQVHEPVNQLRRLMKKPDTVEQYIESLPSEHRAAFRKLHDAIMSAAPGAESCISYSMPAIKLHGVVVYYACWENHMAIYPMPSALKAFAASLGGYVTSKSTVQFPYKAPLPKTLIKDIVRFRMAENISKAEAKEARFGRKRKC